MKKRCILGVIPFLWVNIVTADSGLLNPCERTFGREGSVSDFVGFHFTHGDLFHGKLIVGEREDVPPGFVFSSGEMTYHHHDTGAIEHLQLSDGLCGFQYFSTMELTWTGSKTIKMSLGLSLDIPLIDHCYFTVIGADQNSDNVGYICQISHPHILNDTDQPSAVEIMNQVMKRDGIEEKLCSIFTTEIRKTCVFKVQQIKEQFKSSDHGFLESFSNTTQWQKNEQHRRP